MQTKRFRFSVIRLMKNSYWPYLRAAHFVVKCFSVHVLEQKCCCQKITLLEMREQHDCANCLFDFCRLHVFLMLLWKSNPRKAITQINMNV